MLILLPILIVVFAVLVIRSISSSNKSGTTTTIEPIAPTRIEIDSGQVDDSSSQVEDTGLETADIKIEWQRPEVLAPLKRDPMFVEPIKEFSATKKQEYKPTKYVVQSILISGGGRSAVIAVKEGDSLEPVSHWVHEGESIFEAKVVKINKTSVELEKDNKRWTVPIQKYQDKGTSPSGAKGSGG